MNRTGPIRSLFERNALFETRRNWFYARLLQCSIFKRSIMYDKCSISQRLIVFDWQNFWVSSIKFGYRTRSKSIERLEFDRPFALRGHVTSFYENESYMIFSSKKRLVGPIFSKIIVIWFFKTVPFS